MVRANNSNQWSKFEHSLQRFFLMESREQRYFLAHSGGLDSSALLQALIRLRLGKQLRVFHFHHGVSTNPDTTKFRDQAAAEVAKQVLAFEQAEGYKIPLIHISYQGDDELKSEQDFREARFQAIAENILSDEILLVAHHQDDELETDLIRLIRGVGPEAFGSFVASKNEIRRPFLQFKKAELKEYAKEMSLVWVEDPSNLQADYFRNWVRHKWLPALEAQRPGSVDSLARSLRLMKESLSANKRDTETHVETSAVESTVAFDTQNGFSRSEYLTLSRQRRSELIARCLRELNVKNFTKNHVDEVMKQLDNQKTVHTFKVASCLWSVNAQQICVVKLVSSRL